MDWADDTAYSLNDIADGIRAGFITLENLERWAESHNPSPTESPHLENIARAIREQRVGSRFGRKIGDFIAACSLRNAPPGFMSPLTNRYRFDLVVDPDTVAECRIYKSLALDLVFRSQQLAQLDHKADHLLTRLFTALEGRYVTAPPASNFRLLPESAERRIAQTTDPARRARLVCDALADMTDPFAIRTYQRLFDADFGSIIDLV